MKDWNSRCIESLRMEKKEIEKKYGIKIEQTTILCARCGKSWGLGGHTCFDLALRTIREEKARDLEILKSRKTDLLKALQEEIGPTKASILLEIPERTISKWFQRGNIPNKYLEKTRQILETRPTIQHV